MPVLSVLKILVIPGSAQAGSPSVRLASAMAHELAVSHVDVTMISLTDYPLPIFEADAALQSHPPKHALALRRMIGAHHGVFVATPEHNGTAPLLLQNALAWAGAVQERHEDAAGAIRDRVFALGAVADEASGGLGALISLRHILAVGCGALVVPAQIAVAFAAEAFDEMDRLKAPGDSERLRIVARQLIHVSQQMM